MTTSTQRSRWVQWAAGLAFVVVLAAWIAVSQQSADEAGAGSGSSRSTTSGSTDGHPREVIVQLFQWNWSSIARECPTLKAIGYGAVQTSPPAEHITGSGWEWWYDYQPVSYKIESRRGTREQFAAMVRTCAASGIDIYVDAVVNHMAGGESGTGWAGSPWTHYDYPGLYQTQDFHHCGLAPDDDINDYSSRDQVQTCELVNLADLATEKPYVQGRIADYLNDLISLGVKGFRMDAAKHMATDDIHAIVEKLNGDPVIYQEVIDLGGEPITAKEYEQNGAVLMFGYGRELGKQVQWGNINTLGRLGGSLESSKAVVFTDNHDNQRHGGSEIVTYRKRVSYQIANIYMLAWPYGRPKVMSSFAFTSPDAGAPHDSRGLSSDAVCSADVVAGRTSGEPADGVYVCEHEWPAIAGMVGFHNDAFGQPVERWWTGDNQVAFARGDRGYVVINNSKEPLTGRSWHTRLPAGTYCDVTSGPASQGDPTKCLGRTVTVNADGWFTADVPPFDAIAIHRLRKTA